jgi:hypothetical protein
MTIHVVSTKHYKRTGSLVGLCGAPAVGIYVRSVTELGGMTTHLCAACKALAMVDDDPTTLIAERFGTSARVASDRTARSAEERANERAYVRRDHRRVHITMSTRTQTDD